MEDIEWSPEVTPGSTPEPAAPPATPGAPRKKPSKARSVSAPAPPPGAVVLAVVPPPGRRAPRPRKVVSPPPSRAPSPPGDDEPIVPALLRRVKFEAAQTAAARPPAPRPGKRTAAAIAHELEEVRKQDYANAAKAATLVLNHAGEPIPGSELDALIAASEAVCKRHAAEDEKAQKIKDAKKARQAPHNAKKKLPAAVARLSRVQNLAKAKVALADRRAASGRVAHGNRGRGWQPDIEMPMSREGSFYDPFHVDGEDDDDDMLPAGFMGSPSSWH